MCVVVPCGETMSASSAIRSPAPIALAPAA
jgi:hypothetical protein